MHIRGGIFDIAQRRHPVRPPVHHVPRHRIAVVGIGEEFLRIQAVDQYIVGGKQHVPAASVAMETIGAFLGGEQHVAAHFLGGQLRLAPHITVEFGIARNQSADELGYRKANPVHADAFAAERLLEQRRVHRNGCDALHDGIGIAGKFGRIQKGFPNQLLQVLCRILGGTVPAESLGVVGHIEQWQHVMRGQSPGNAPHPAIHQTGIVQTGLERMRLTVAGRAAEHRIALMAAAQPDIVKEVAS